jgi:hypothetical protein
MSGNAPNCNVPTVSPQLQIISNLSNNIILVDLNYNSYIKTSNPPLTFQYNITSQNGVSSNVYYTVTQDSEGVSGNQQNAIITIYNLIPSTSYQFVGRTKYLGCDDTTYATWTAPVTIYTAPPANGSVAQIQANSASNETTIIPQRQSPLTTPLNDFLNTNGSKITVTTGPTINNSSSAELNSQSSIPFSYLNPGDFVLNDNDLVTLNNIVEQKLVSDIQSYEPTLVDKIVNKLQTAINASGSSYLRTNSLDNSPSYEQTQQNARESFSQMGTDYFAAQDSTELTMQQGRFNYVPPKLPFQYNTTF